MNKKDLISYKGNLLLGVTIIEQEYFKDNRGIFFESWNKNKLNKLLSKDLNFVQDNISISHKGVIRGLHYQLDPQAQGKLVRCLEGIIFDVIVDLRCNSKTFGEWGFVELTGDIKNQIWIPEGFAHGFLTISDYALVQYKTTKLWNKKYERSISWKDKDIDIKWPKNGEQFPILSKKDSESPTFKEIQIKGDIFP